MALNLKRWAVRHLSGLLSDYLEGITEQNLQASLSLEVGQVDIRHVRVQPGLVESHGLKLLSSDVTISARIPWRSVRSEPTVITVRDVWVEVQVERLPDARDDDPQALRRWRERRRRWVQGRIDAAREVAAPSDAPDEAMPKRRSMAARLGHAVLRQLQVRVEGMKVRVHPAEGAGVPTVVDVFCSHVALDEGRVASEALARGSIGDVPADVRAHAPSLDKVLELAGFSAQLQVPGQGPGVPSLAAEPRYVELRNYLARQQKSLEVSAAGDQSARCREVLQTKAQLQICPGIALPMLGPLSMDSRLWHSADDGLMWLGVELQVDGEATSAIRLSPIVAQFTTHCMSWYQSMMAPPRRVRSYRCGDGECMANVAADVAHGQGGRIGMPSGPEYMELCMRRLRGEEVDEALLEEVEDAASVEWLARWQLRCHEQLNPEIDDAQEQPPQMLGWLRKRFRGKGPQQRQAAQESDAGADEFQDAAEDFDSEDEEESAANVDAMDYLVEQDDGEVEPRTVMLRCIIRHCTILECQLEPSVEDKDSSNILRVEGDMECCADVATATTVLSGLREAAWSANVSSKLSSIAVLLGSDPLVVLKRESVEEVSQDDAFEECFEDEEEATAAGHGHAVQLMVLCVRNGGAAGPLAGAPAPPVPWSVSARLKQEPFRFLLAPRSMRRAMEIAISVARPFHPKEAEQSISVEASLQVDTDSKAEMAASANNFNDADRQIALDLDLDVAAPVLRWGLVPEGNVTISFGRLLLRTSGTSPPPARLGASERCTWQAFACYCQLTETSVAVVHGDGSQSWVYDPSTISLRAWRENAGGKNCWQVDAKSEVVRWTVNPDVVKVAGQLPSSFDFALSPLWGLLADVMSSKAEPSLAFGQPAESASVAPVNVSPPAAAAPRQVCVRLSLRRCEIGSSPAGTPQRVSASFEGIQAEYEASAGRLDALGCVASCDLAYAGTSAVRCAKGGSLKVSNADHHILLRGGSALIEVDWHEHCIRGIIGVLRGAWDSYFDSRKSSQGLLVVGDSAGMSAQIWSHYVSRPLQDRVKRRAERRLADLLDQGAKVAGATAGAGEGLAAVGAETGDGAQELAAADPQMAAAGVSAGVGSTGDGRSPTARGKVSVEVHLAYEGVEFTVHQDEAAGDPGASSTVKVAVKGADGVFRGFRSGDASASISLLAAHVTLCGRRLLTPRRADKLLKVDILRTAAPRPGFHWAASWAQVCVLFRQRDYDALSHSVRSSVLAVVAELRQRDAASPRSCSADGPDAIQGKGEPVPAVASQEVGEQRPAGTAVTEGAAEAIAEAAPPRAAPARFHLEIGAPCVFLPTDGAVRQADGRHRSRGGSCDDELEVDGMGGEPFFRPKRGEGFLVFDFGHVAASGGGAGTSPGVTAMQLCGAHVLGAVPSPDPALQDVLRPVSFDAVLKSGEGPVEFHLTSMAPGEADAPELGPPCPGSPRSVDHHLVFNRGHLTLILDVLAENICWAGRPAMMAARAAPAPAPPAPAPPRRQDAKPQDSKQPSPVRKGGFIFSWTWPGNLVWDIGFTAAAPLVRFQLRNGRFCIDNWSQKSSYDLQCMEFSATDLRVRSRNAVRSLLDCAKQPCGEACFQVAVAIPADTDSVVDVRMARPVWHVLPQLVMDLLTAGVSSWQQCTFRNDRPQLPQPPGPTSDDAPRDTRCTRVELHLLDGTFRIAEKWSEPSEHFEIAGSLLICIVLHSEGMSIARFDLEGGSLRLCSSRRRASTLCPCIEWMVRGEQRRTDDEAFMKRHTKFEFRSIIIPPYSIRMSAQDHRAMMRAILELCSLDGESAEPSEELASRDPLALSLVENRIIVTAEVAVQGAEVQVLGEERGHAWPGLRGHVRCPQFSAAIEIRPGVVPTINLHTKELELELWAHNHRLGAWEPVVPVCWWKVYYLTQRKPSGGPREVFVRSDAVAVGPVRCVLSANFVQLAARVFRDGAADMRYGHLLAGLNISGVSCNVAVEGGGEAVLAAASHVQPLDELLKSSGRGGGQPAQPCLVLSLRGRPDGATCRVPLGREVCIPWNTKAAGLLVCRLIMPRPPQILLLISSTVCIENRTQTDLQVRFMAPSIATRRGGNGTVVQDDQKFEPVVPGAAFRTADARFLHVQGPMSSVATSSFDDGSPAPRPPPCGPDGALCLGAGQLLAAPPEAQLRTGQVVLQVRPAPEAAGNIAYEWSDQFFTVPEAVRSASGGVTVCSVPPEPGLPKHWLHLYAADGDLDEGWCTVEVQAPFTMVNACPCDVLCRLNPPITHEELGKDRSSVHIEKSRGASLVIEDGRGGEVSVPPGFQCEVMPLQLDDSGYFYWTYNGRRSRLKAARGSATTNCVIVFFSAVRGTVDWRFFHASMTPATAPAPIRIASQSSMPVFDTVAEDACMSFALRGPGTHTTSWSFPVKALSSLRSIHEVIMLEHRGMIVRLHAFRRGRDLVVYAKWWFVDSTGLGVQLLHPGDAGPMHPVPRFDGRIAFLPELRNEAGDGVAYMQLLSGGGPVASARVPDVGGSEAVRLSPLHRCCLRTEMVALPEAMGVSCCLVSLLPAMLLFNHAEFPVGFRQAGCPNGEVRWLLPRHRDVLWWTSSGPAVQELQVAARVPSSRDGSWKCTEWSEPFEVQEAMIGAYPVALKLGPAGWQLLCLCIDQDAGVFSITSRGPECCHSLLNKHKSVVLDANLEGAADRAFVFKTPFDERTFFGGPGPSLTRHNNVPPSGGGCISVSSPCSGSGQGVARAKPRLSLRITSVNDPAEKAAVMVDLKRTATYRVPLHPSIDPASSATAARSSQTSRGSVLKSTLRIPSVVSVQLRNRVAIVTVRPGRNTAGSAQEDAGPTTAPASANAAAATNGDSEVGFNTYTFEGELRVDCLLVALIAAPASPTAGSRAAAATARCSEVFTASLEGISATVEQTPARRREACFQCRSAQLDMQQPCQDVIFKSTTRPFLKTKCLRDDVAMLDVHLRCIEVELGEMEVSFTDAAWERVRLLRRSFAPETGGVNIEDVVARAQSPYCLEAPQASTRFIINRLDVHQAKVDVWCRIYLPDAHYVPKTLRDTLQVMSFGTNRLDVSGAQVRVPQQTLFSMSTPAEGSLNAIVARVSDHYLPHVKASWRSLLQHSNIFLGGLFSRHTWMPRKRRNWAPADPLCDVGPGGELRLSDTGQLCRGSSSLSVGGGNGDGSGAGSAPVARAKAGAPVQGQSTSRSASRVWRRRPTA